MEPQTDREMAMTCLDVYHRALSWIARLAAIKPQGRDDSEGFLLAGEEADALMIPLREIFELIADGMRAGPAARFTACELARWKKGIRRFVVRIAEGRIQHARPGERPLPGIVDQVEFAPRPKCLPFFAINCGLSRAASVLGLKARDLYFRWRSLPIHCGDALFQAVTLGGANPRRALAAIDRWREDTDARIGGRPESVVAVEILGVPPLPDGARGAILPRKRIAKLVRYCRRTLQRWDKQGYAAEGLPWAKGWRDSGGYVLYDVGMIWPALAVLLGRGKNRRSLMERVGELDREIREWRAERRAKQTEDY